VLEAEHLLRELFRRWLKNIYKYRTNQLHGLMMKYMSLKQQNIYTNKEYVAKVNMKES
jgi:hypothetical protein